ncbi:antiviral reverse transcriptase Drt3a [Neomicrococcus lactis]|uniref:antiviral reverse transcriptase Drt3a n=1 Tax=Neomicrococcus lactis TaxID=732241 RepID=UPI0023004E16|nr:antiviral reverse transcriptase Drt3a [Neomicrococcus lactis]
MAHDLEYSTSSFLRIATLEARRGHDDPGQLFTSVNETINDLRDLHKERRKATGLASNRADARAVYNSYRTRIGDLQKVKRECLENELRLVGVEFSQAMKAKEFTWGLSPGPQKKNRNTYQTAGTAIQYFPMKQLESSLRKDFKIVAPNRNRMIAQLRDAIAGKMPRSVLRSDISSFFESVPHVGLMEVLKGEGRLSRTSIYLIEQLLTEWRTLTGRDCGIPTGVGLSAYLAEVYARQVDQSILRDPRIHFYGRYVDDIVVVLRSRHDLDDMVTILDKRLADLGLSKNDNKTQRVEAKDDNNFDLKDTFDFLGYSFSKNTHEGEVRIEMNDQSKARYKHRLTCSFNRWAAAANRAGGNEGLLLNRIRFLAGNTKLVNSKGRALTGIYFNYPHLSVDSNSLRELDNHLEGEIVRVQSFLTENLKNRLDQISFSDGFKYRIFNRFSQNELTRLVAVWRD